MPKVLILCPTHDHADTLFASVASVVAQRFTDWEMVVIGDGAPPRTRQVMEAIQQAEPRVRYVWHPKSERYGEPHRDAVIRASTAEYVCQLSDDDLWTPEHLDVMTGLLEHAEWANQAPLRVLSDGRVEWWPINHGTEGIRRSITAGVPVSAGPNFVAYRREAYLRLPEGWTSAPKTGPSDAFMWAKFFRLGSLRVASSAASSAIKFPSSEGERRDRSPERRLAEIAPWLARLAEPGLTAGLRARATIRNRMRALFDIHQAQGAGSWTEALAMAGLKPVPAKTPPKAVLDGAPMPLPLSETQRAEVIEAWLAMGPGGKRESGGRNSARPFWRGLAARLPIGATGSRRP